MLRLESAQFAAISAVIAGAVWLSGCADLTSISRSTELPGVAGEGHGVAIHLDAKQRLAFAKEVGVVCAEPSPDALSAFAASFGGGIALPQYGSAAVSHALNESAASIGLRTQSITLMRDALYRICEAYYNHALNPVMVMQLLGRSQDLTLAILAIEQLTQPVVAQQAALGGSASSTSSASLLVNQQMLDAAREREREANDRLANAQAKRDQSEQTVKDKKTALEELPQTSPDRKKAQEELNQATKDFDRDDQALKDAQASANEAKQNRETIEKSLKNAQAMASANAQGSAVLSAPIILKQPPSDKTVEIVANAVKEIVSTVVKNDHKVDACLSIISADPSWRAQQRAEEKKANMAKDNKKILQSLNDREAKYNDTFEFCTSLISQAKKLLLQ